VNAIDIDAAGYSYLVGEFTDSVSFGNTTLVNSGHSLYIVKYNSAGVLIWAQVAGSGTAIYAGGIAADENGNVSVAGGFAGTAYFGSSAQVSYTSSASYDVYVARYTSTGALSWAKTMSAAGYDYGADIGNDAAGNLYITGEFHKTSFQGSAATHLRFCYHPDAG
jgi:hypothetical protein